MPGVTVLGTELTFDNHFKLYNGDCMTAVSSVPVTLCSHDGNYDVLVQIAERTLLNWSAQLEKVLPEVKAMLFEQDFLPASQVDALTVSDLGVRNFSVRDDGFGSAIFISLNMEKLRSDPDDDREVDYVESCKDGTVYMDIYAY